MRKSHAELAPMLSVDSDNSRSRSALAQIAAEVQAFREPSDIQIKAYALAKAREDALILASLENGEAELEHDIKTSFATLRALAAPLMERPQTGPNFFGYLRGDDAAPSDTTGSKPDNMRGQTHA